jgi:hypothetical protein
MSGGERSFVQGYIKQHGFAGWLVREDRVVVYHLGIQSLVVYLRLSGM